MQFGCHRHVVVVSQGISGSNIEMCPGFPPSQTTLVTAASGDKGLWVVWCSSDEVRLRIKEREILIDRIKWKKDNKQCLLDTPCTEVVTKENAIKNIKAIQNG